MTHTLPTALSRLGRPHRSVPLAAVLTAASAVAMAPCWALGGEGEPGPGQLLQLRCDAAVEATGVIGRTVAFHTDDDGRMDLIAQVSDQLIWVTAPDPLQYSSTLGMTGVTAFAPFQRIGSGVGALIVADGSGVSYVERDMNQPRAFLAIHRALGASGWTGARSLTTADVDGDGDMDIVGLSADGTQLLRLDQTAPEVFEDQMAVDLGVELDELRAIHWGASGVSLAAILKGSVDSACIFGVDGTLYRAESFGDTIDDIAVAHGAHAPGEDGLVVLCAGEITLIRPGALKEAPVDVAPVAPTSMSTADVDGDGRNDVLLNSSTIDEVTVLLAQDRSTTGGLTFVAPNAATAISIPLEQTGASMAGQRANPVGADFDLDGDIDIFQLIESTRGACVQRNSATDETAYKPVVTEFELYEAPTGSLAFMNVDALLMPDGFAPDRLEVTLSTLAQGATLDDDEQHCLHMFHDVGSVTVGNGDDMVTLNIPCVLGDVSTLLIRGFRDDQVTHQVQRVGVESSYRLVRTNTSLQRGTDSDIDRVHTNGGSQGTPPPPPPTPIDPFA